MTNNEKERIAVDLDDVSFDMRNHVLNHINNKYGTKFGRNDIQEWNAILPYKDKPIEYKKELFDRFAAPGFIESTPLMPGAKEGIEELKERGHPVFFLTSRNKKYQDATRRAANKIHPDVPVIHAAEGKHKFVNDFDVLLDDSPKELTMVGIHGGNPVAFDQPWNRQVPQLMARRVASWPEFLELMRKKGYKE
jgi:5'(3')-deoxyribonucleotidase